MSRDDSSDDRFQLSRFVEAQAHDYASALAEIRSGRKQSHWMWYVFPQLEGLGSSPTSKRYAIKSLDEAAAYLRHPLLGPRLIECTEAVLAVAGRTAEDIFGSIDALKLRSSATLFACAATGRSVFDRLLDQYFAGARDEQTLNLLGLS